jgi:cytochrome c oxidase subunit 1
MPRRIPDYPDAYAGWNAIFESFGSIISLLGMSLFFYILAFSFKSSNHFKWRIFPSNNY